MRSTSFTPRVLALVLVVISACTGTNSNTDAPGATSTQISGPTDVTVTAPDVATFTADVIGTAPLAVVWQSSLDGLGWIDLGPPTTLASAPAATTYSTSATTLADSGVHYRVTVQGAADATAIASTAATLTVLATPALTTDVRDVAVPEGATATFVAVASGGALSYAWEEAGPGGGFQPIAAATSATLVLPSVTTAMDNRRYRVTATNAVGSVLSREARLTVFPASVVARVYAQYAPVNTVIDDAVIATGSTVGIDAVADLAAGTFAARADAMANPDATRNGYAGVLRPLIFVNTTGADVTIPTGGIHLAVSGTYAHTMLAARTTGASINANLIARVANVTYSAGGLHQWGRAYDAQGNVIATSYSRFEPHTIQNGGTAVASTFTTSAVMMELALPAIVVPAAGQIEVTTAIYVIANDLAKADAFATPATLTMKLPAGVTFDRNTTTTLAWVTNLP